MIAIGFFLAGLMLWSTLQWIRGKLSGENIAQQRWLMGGWIFAATLGYIAVESGWIVRCVGRQPWTVYEEIRTTDAASNLPAGEILTSLTGFSTIYALLFVCALFFGSRIIRQGPNLEQPVPGVENEPAIATEPPEHLPNRRPTEGR